ncbi:MAG: cold shock domain-containing protein [Erysipelothrix sp.]|nr:cold shock domain-containing protein [Erysipelothrix sp.]
MKGIIKKFDKSKGFGFIAVKGHKDVFFHYSHIIVEGFKSIEAGTEVEFDLVKTERGSQAHNIIRIS